MMDGYTLITFKKKTKKKQCVVDCWFHCFYLELEFVFEKNSFLSGVERHVIANRII